MNELRKEIEILKMLIVFPGNGAIFDIVVVKRSNYQYLTIATSVLPS